MNDQDRTVLDAPDPRTRPRSDLAKPGALALEAGVGLVQFGERQRLDFEKSQRPLRIVDRATLRYVAVNDAAAKLYGYSREEFLALTLKDTRHPDEHAALMGSFEQSEGYLVPGGPRRHVKKSGEVFLAEVVTQDVIYDGRTARVSLTIDVTERTRAEEELRRQKNLLAAIIDNLPMGVFIRDAQTGRYVLRNRFCENANGYRVESSVGLTPHDLFPKEQADLAAATDRQALESGRMVEVAEQEMLGRSGEPRLFQVRKVPLFGEDGRPWMVVGIADDITERKQADEELRRQQKLLAAIVENLPLGIFIKEAETLRLLMANRSANVMVKYPDRSAIGKTPHELFPGAQADDFSRTDRRALETRQMVEIPEQEVTARSGKTRIQHVRKVPLFDEQGKPWVVVGIADDVTARKQVENALRESNEFLRSVIESSRDCIKVLDLEGRLLSISTGGQRPMEIADARSLLGRAYLDFWGGAEHDEAEAALAAARAGEAARFTGYCPTAGGNPKWWDEIVTPILGKEGIPEKLLVVSRDITEHRRAEQTLRDSEARLALAVESTGLGLWDWNMPTGEVWRHPLWARILGYEPGDIAPHIRMWKELCHPDDYPQSQERLMAHFEGRMGLYMADYRMRHKRGSWTWIGCRAKVIERGEDGTPRRMIGYIRDISDRRGMEQALRESQEQFRAVTETANEGIVSADDKGRIIYLNQSATRLFGYSVEEAIGEPLTLLMPARFRAAHEEGFRRVLAGHPSSLAGKTVEFLGRRKDGSEFPLELSVASWTTGSGVFFTGIMRDITPRKRAESALRESEERFRQLAENIREVFWICTPQFEELIYVSPAYEEIWGRSRESLYRDPHSWMEPVHPDDRHAVREGQSRMAKGQEMDVEYRVVRPDGTLRWIRDRSYPMQRGDGTPLCCGIAEDVTSRKREEEERITHAFHQRDALVREVHHRIKNHLQGIAGLLRNKAADDPGAARTMEAAVAQLQSVAVVYGLQSELAESGVPLRRLLEAICASAEGLSAARVARRFPAAGGRVRLAETEAVPVAVALNELVFNAIEHGQRRAGSPAIEIALKEGRNGAEIRIVNRGRLPARFNYARGIGTGTGLDLVRTLLGSAGSALEYSAREGKVEVTLSLKEPLLAERKPAARKGGPA